MQGVGWLIHAEALAVDHAFATQSQQSLGGHERRLHQDLSRVAGLVLLSIGYQLDVLLFHLVDGRALSPTHPTRDLSQIAATTPIGDGSADAIGAALRRLHATTHRLLFGSEDESLLVHLLLAPLALGVLPFQAHRAHFHGPVFYRFAIEIGDDDVNLDRIAKLHESALGAQAHVEIGGMHQQVRGGGPGLAVDVHHRGFRRNAGGLRRIDRLEVDAQVVSTRCVGYAFVGPDLGVVQLRLAPPAEQAPPGDPDAEGEIVPVGWLV